MDKNANDLHATARAWFALKVSKGEQPEQMVGGQLDGLPYFRVSIDGTGSEFLLTDLGLFSQAKPTYEQHQRKETDPPLRGACDNLGMESRERSQGTLRAKGLLSTAPSLDDQAVHYASPVEAAWNMPGFPHLVLEWVVDDLTRTFRAMKQRFSNEPFDEVWLLAIPFQGRKFSADWQARHIAASVQSPLYCSPESPLEGSRPETGDEIEGRTEEVRKYMLPALLELLNDQGFRVVRESEDHPSVQILPPVEWFVD